MDALKRRYEFHPSDEFFPMTAAAPVDTPSSTHDDDDDRIGFAQKNSSTAEEQHGGSKPVVLWLTVSSPPPPPLSAASTYLLHPHTSGSLHYFSPFRKYRCFFSLFSPSLTILYSYSRPTCCAYAAIGRRRGRSCI